MYNFNVSYSDIIKQIKPSVLKVYAFSKDKSNNSTGSGFVFRQPGIFVTCNHVIDIPNPTILLKADDSKDPILATVVLKDVEHDIALLKFDDDSRKPLEEESIENIEEGIDVIFSGYPLSLQNLTTHRGLLSSITKDATGITTYLVDGTVNPGNSGCPLMTSKGKVIGIVNAMRRENSDLIQKVNDMVPGAVSLYNVDTVDIFKALIRNSQLGIGYSVPVSYVPTYKNADIKPTKIKKTPKIKTK